MESGIIPGFLIITKFKEKEKMHVQQNHGPVGWF